MTSHQTTELIGVMADINRYSPKVSEPLKHLHNAGWLSDEDVSLILLAGRINRYPSTLLGFSIAYCQAVKQAVPIADTIKMAASLNRRFNLGWSPARIRDEHNKMSRMVTLKALALDNEHFDVSFVAKHCSDQFPGYWITNSRRLGMEGLRQRHCVASYGAGIKNQRYGIAVVFIDKTRWTVQVNSPQSDGYMPRIAQAQTRMGGRASPEIRECLRELLGLPEPQSCEAIVQEVSAKTLMDKPTLMQTVLQACRDIGIEEIYIRFCGCGDSGSFDTAEIYPQELSEQASETTVMMRNLATRQVEGEWKQIVELKEISLADAAEHLVEELVDETGVDWYNNEGGDGWGRFSVDEGTLELTVNYNLSEVGSHEVYDLETGETA